MDAQAMNQYMYGTTIKLVIFVLIAGLGTLQFGLHLVRHVQYFFIEFHHAWFARSSISSKDMAKCPNRLS